MNKTFLLVLRIIVALILLQTLRFKFLAHPDSVYIFTTLGIEPYGRIGIGILELIASILLFTNRTTWRGIVDYRSYGWSYFLSSHSTWHRSKRRWWNAVLYGSGHMGFKPCHFVR